MNSIQQAFQKKKKLLIPFITAFYPNRTLFWDILTCLIESGVGCIEIGFPFSDPIADGPTIQNSSQQSLDQGFKRHDFIEDLQSFNNQGVPLILMTYANPFLSWTQQIKDTNYKGLEGLIAPDIPAHELEQILKKTSYPWIPCHLITTKTKGERLQYIIQKTQGFIYLVSRSGITGDGSFSTQSLQATCNHIKQISPQTPIAIGFGINQPKQAQELYQWSDGVIIGSHLIKFCTENHTSKGFFSKLSKWIQPFLPQEIKS